MKNLSNVSRDIIKHACKQDGGGLAEKGGGKQNKELNIGGGLCCLKENCTSIRKKKHRAHFLAFAGSPKPPMDVEQNTWDLCRF